MIHGAEQAPRTFWAQSFGSRSIRGPPFKVRGAVFPGIHPHGFEPKAIELCRAIERPCNETLARETSQSEFAQNLRSLSGHRPKARNNTDQQRQGVDGHRVPKFIR
jgi:hypothetical protein